MKNKDKVLVALYGNICNNLYSLARSLNSTEHIEAHLYIDEGSEFQSQPQNEDPGLVTALPSWIHVSKKWNPIRFLRFLDTTFIHELRRYDVVIFSDLGPILAPFLIGRKRVFFVTGMDLTRVPFPMRYIFDSSSLSVTLKRLFISVSQWFGVRHCDLILAPPFKPLSDAFQKLGLRRSLLSKSYYPVLINTDKFRRTKFVSKPSGVNNSFISNFKFIVFHPARIIIDTSEDLVETGHYKGNEKLLRGFAKFVHNGGHTDACLVLIDRIQNKDSDSYRKQIKNLNLESNIVWLNPYRSSGFTRDEMIYYYSNSHVLADDFGAGWFGSIVLEACACELPIISYVDPTVMNSLYPWHPILSTKDEADISFSLGRLYSDHIYRDFLGRKSREWVVRFHSMQNGTDIYIQNFKRDKVING